MTVKTGNMRRARFLGAFISVALAAILVFRADLDSLFALRSAIIVVGIVFIAGLVASVTVGNRARLPFRLMAGLLALACFYAAGILGYQIALAPSGAPLLFMPIAACSTGAGATLLYVFARGNGPKFFI